MNKKLLSLIMAVAMIATLAMPALASSGGTRTGDAINYQGSTKTPSVTVTMPTSANKIILNPYGMSVTVTSATGVEVATGTSYDADTMTVSSGQILSMTQYIKNSTPSAMKVGVKATATVSGDTQLATKFCTGKETTKNAYVVVELQSVSSGAVLLQNGWFTNVASGDSSINEKCYPQIVPTAAGKDAPAILAAPAAAVAADGTVTPNYIAVQTFGNLAAAPTQAWTSADTLDVKLEFTFTPTVTHTATVDAASTTVKVSTSINPGTNNAGASSAETVMGTVVRVIDTNKKQPTVKDANNAVVTVTKVVDGLYYFTMPATDVTVTAGT